MNLQLEVSCEQEIVPQYAATRARNKIFGALKHEEHHWRVEAEPQVMQMVRALFEATSSDGSGWASIPITKRNTADLNWFMMRYPLRIIDEQFYDGSYRRHGTSISDRPS